MKQAPRLSALVLALLLLPTHAQTQVAPTGGGYRIYDASGKPATLEQVVEAVAASEAVFVGEIHSDPTAHTVELQLLQGAHARLAREADKRNARPLVLSLEMFERDVQSVLDEYLTGLIQER